MPGGFRWSSSYNIPTEMCLHAPSRGGGPLTDHASSPVCGRHGNPFSPGVRQELGRSPGRGPGTAPLWPPRFCTWSPRGGLGTGQQSDFSSQRQGWVKGALPRRGIQPCKVKGSTGVSGVIISRQPPGYPCPALSFSFSCVGGSGNCSGTGYLRTPPATPAAETYTKRQLTASQKARGP